MNKNIAKQLCDINTTFYQSCAQSFSTTRTSSWNGWDLCSRYIPTKPNTSILDLAAGNLRFEEHIYTNSAAKSLNFYAIDNCDTLAQSQDWTQEFKDCLNYKSLNIIDTLLEDKDLSSSIDSPLCDTCVSFGFMHHIPTKALRLKVLDALLAHTKPGGYTIVSFWQFTKQDSLKRKAHLTTPLACEYHNINQEELEENDWFIGWKNEENLYRYCHDFTDKEIDELVDSLSDKSSLVDKFYADGKNNNLNCYVVLKRI